jgi:16S rRNA (adenine1518-N6/adenine1519-N6)-dimethyltransferase
MADRSSTASGVRAKKSLGQNFLHDRSYLAQIVEAAELSSHDLVLEIGPGTGSLTQELSAAAGGVVAVELDDRLIVPLRAQFATQFERVQIVHGDILELDPPGLVEQLALQMQEYAKLPAGVDVAAPSYKVAANLPYYITSAVLRQLLEARRPPRLAVVLVQLEVAQRICAQQGDMSLLAVSIQYYARPQFVQRVPAGAFRPVPKVDSAILRLDVYTQPLVNVDPSRFFHVVRAGFGQKRKQLLNSLSAGLGRSKVDVGTALGCAAIDPSRRAETLSLEEWAALCRCLD